VCRRLALLERLCDEAKGDLRLGLLAPVLARQLVRLPVGNQAAVLATARRESLLVAEVRGVIDLLRKANPEQEQFILEKPREALLLAEGIQGPVRDMRLSPGGNQVARRLRFLLDALAGMENWLRYPGLAELKRSDRVLLRPRFQRLSRDAGAVAALTDDLLMQLPAETAARKQFESGTSHGRENTQRDHPALAGEGVAAADRAGVAGGADDRPACP
jgi:hypothetical protein